jgi:outer membrane receptor protein involved in Fe transport
MQFFPENFFPDLRQKLDSKSARFGFRHAFSPRSDTIGSAIFQEDKGEAEFPGLGLDSKQRGYNLELQQIYRANRFNLIGGAGYFDSDFENIARRTVAIPPNPPMVVEVADEYDFKHTNLYLYSRIKFPESVIWTLGASVDFYEDEFHDYDTTQVNPKLGIIWNPYPKTTIRAAWFRTLKRNLMSDQTIEPTQVAGFNQFFDEYNGTESWRYGAAIDQKFSKSLFGGVEASKRDLEFPFYNYRLDPVSPPLDKADFNDDSVRVYLYWAPTNWLTTSTEFHYENFKTDPDYPEFYSGAEFSEIETYSVPLGINFFLPSGFSAKLSPMYVHQEGEFGNAAVAPTITDSDSFWLVNLGLSYRLPKRYGIVSLEAKNLLDADVRFLELDANHPKIYPEQVLLGKLTLSF